MARGGSTTAISSSPNSPWMLAAPEPSAAVAWSSLGVIGAIAVVRRRRRKAA